ncbi:hypothetical protein TSUD_418340 [Trifolium subterraneum]|uniref:RNase H type-1 domain-containing protein n=1 Tax=Trifolium subterraneum TaxID=3900 RepID=A0A2Z6P6N3_TRISU|nr:hypothetical protein TSUD_418340 [Trifolium subterraneum]
MSSDARETACWTGFTHRRNIADNNNSAMACYVWTKPARGTLKCNFDTVCYDAQNLYCVEACIRDDRSMFVEAIMRNYNGKPLIAEAEAHGVLEVLQWMGEHNSISDPIVIETNCLQVVQAISSGISLSC